MELKLRLPEVAVEAKAVEAIADLFRPRIAYVLSRLHCAKWGVNAIGNRLPPSSRLLYTVFTFFWPV